MGAAGKGGAGGVRAIFPSPASPHPLSAIVPRAFSMHLGALRPMRLPALFCVTFFSFISLAAHAAEPFEIREGDRVVFLGDTLLEREGNYGCLETRMHEQFPDRHFIVRNLSWAGETPRGWSRASFDPPEKGWDRLKEDVARVRPTVVFLGFGMAASLQEMTDRSADITLNPDPARYGAEPMSAARFKKELDELMDAIAATGRKGDAPAANASGIRFVLLSPIRHEDLRAIKPGLPDPARHNQLLEQYTAAIGELAQEKGARFVDLFHAWEKSPRKTNSPADAAALAGAAADIAPNGIHLSELGYSAFAEDAGAILGWKRDLPLDRAAFDAWKERHRQFSRAVQPAVIRKNELFFHQFRPANSTYLFGFRKHEQGQNAKEMPMFDPLIEAAEKEIDRLKSSARAPGAGSGAPAGTSTTPGAAALPTEAAAALPGTPPPLPDFTVEDGYQIELWAQNPLLEKPTQMNWDPQGRLWVCSSSLYPQIEPGQTANDKILILADTDGDGKADKSTVFADGLLIPTGVAPDLVDTGKGGSNAAAVSQSGIRSPGAGISAAGCYVGQSTELLLFTDTDGDGHADSRRIVFSGFGTEDTHHIVHTLHWGPDGRLYFHQSVYIHTHMETPWGMVRLNAGGVFAYDPRTERVAVFCKGLWNTWGQQEDDWGQMFLTDGAGRDGISWAFPGAVFAPSEGARRTVGSVSPGSYPKFCGLEILRSPHFPAAWQGNMITCDFRAHRIVRFGITDLAAGGADAATASPAAIRTPQSAMRSGYVTSEQPDLVRTSDLSFRPIDVRLGPDGALYVADWSNPVINHGEVDFRDPRRDHHMGRIWRITRKGAPALKWEPLLGKKNEELLGKLLSQSAWEKEQARRVTSATIRNDSPEFGQWSHQDPAAINSDPARGFEESLLKARIGFREDGDAPRQATAAQPRLRAFAARMLGEGAFRQGERSGFREDSEALDRLKQLAGDANPGVRLEAMRALARIPTARSAGLVLDAAAGVRIPPVDDPHYDFAAWQSINDLARPWTDAIASGTWKTEGRDAQLAYGLKAIDPALAGATLSRLFAAGKVPMDGSGPWIELIGSAGGPAELQRLLDGLLAGYVGDCCETDETRAIDTKLMIPGAAADRATAALVATGRDGRGERAGRAHRGPALFHEQGAIGLGAIRLAGLWKVPDAVAKIGELIDDRQTQPAQRRACVDGLRAAGGPAALNLLSILTRAGESADTRAAALVAIAQIKLDAGISKAAEVLPTITDEAALLGAWRGLLGVKGAANAFAARFGQPQVAKNLPRPVLAAAVQAAREAGKPATKLLVTLAPLAGIAAADPQSAAGYAELAAQTRQNGDPARGELIYRRAASACVTCHAIGGAGGKVGPDLTSMGASAPLDYIIESLIDPAAKVKEGYNAVTLTMRDGAQATGILARESAAEFILRDATGREQAVPKEMVTGKTDIGSLMPVGLTAAMQPRERLDLFAFLGELGKPGPFDASKGTVARFWRIYPGSAVGEVTGAAIDLTKNPGIPGYTLVDGRFTKDLLTEAVAMAGVTDAALLVTQFQASGKTHLKLTGAAEAWLDGQPLALVGGEVAPDLAIGTHTLVVKIGVAGLPAVLRAESPEARFLGN